MNVDTLKTLKKGDTFFWGKAFPGMSDEKILWRVLDTGDENVTMAATWFGALLGVYTMSKNSNEVLSIRRGVV